MKTQSKTKEQVQVSVDKGKELKRLSNIGKYYNRETLKLLDQIISKIDTYIALVKRNNDIFPKEFLEYRTSKLFFDSFMLDILSLCENLDMGSINSWWMGLGLSTVNFKALQRLENMPLNMWHLIAMRKKHPTKGFLAEGKEYDSYFPEFGEKENELWSIENGQTFDGQAFERYRQWCHNDPNISIKDENVQVWINEYKRIFTKWYDFVHYTRFFCGYDEYHKKLIFDNKINPEDWDNTQDILWYVSENRKREDNLIETREFFKYIKNELNKESKLALQKTSVYKNRFRLWLNFKESNKK